MTSDLLPSIRGFIADNFLFRSADEAPGDDESLLDSGIVDSTGVLELVAFLEDTFAITVADTDIVPENLDSLAAIARYVENKGGKAA